MFASSSQLKHWMFNNEGEIQSLRQEANERYVEEHGTKMSVSLNLMKRFIKTIFDNVYMVIFAPIFFSPFSPSVVSHEWANLRLGEFQ